MPQKKSKYLKKRISATLGNVLIELGTDKLRKKSREKIRLSIEISKDQQAISDRNTQVKQRFFSITREKLHRQPGVGFQQRPFDALTSLNAS